MNVVETAAGRALLGVLERGSALGVETESGVHARKELLLQLEYNSERPDHRPPRTQQVVAGAARGRSASLVLAGGQVRGLSRVTGWGGLRLLRPRIS